MKRLLITEEEKNRILKMHKSKILTQKNISEDFTTNTTTVNPNGDDYGFGVNIDELMTCIIEKVGGTEKDLPESCKTTIVADTNPDLTKCAVDLVKKFPTKALDITSCFGVEGIELPKIPGIPDISKIPGIPQIPGMPKIPGF